MQESWARLHGWRRRGRMAGGGSGGGLGSRRKGGLDEKQLPRDGGVWTFFFFFFRAGVGGVEPSLCNSEVLKATAALEAWGK